MNETIVIEMPRGDRHTVIFSVTDSDGEAPQVDITDIYFTVKRSFSDRTFLIQKTLTGGEIEPTEDAGTYMFVIEPSDTDTLRYGKYAFDIELVGPELKETTTGTLRLTYEATFAENEGD